MKSDVLSDEIRVWGFENNFIVFDDASLGFGLKISPIDIACSSDEEKNQLSSSLIQFLNGLPADLDFQLVCDIRAGNSSTICAFKDLSLNSEREMAKYLTNERADMFSARLFTDVE